MANELRTQTVRYFLEGRYGVENGRKWHPLNDIFKEEPSEKAAEKDQPRKKQPETRDPGHSFQYPLG